MGLAIRISVVILCALTVAYGLWLRLALSVYGTKDADSVFLEGTRTAVLGDLTDLVDVFIGTTNGGHVFPGATVPHGMVKAGMDTDSPGNHAGYDADPKYFATGFSQLHDDGTGGATPLSNFKLWPLRDCPDFERCPTSIRNRKVARALKLDGLPDDSGAPGYFSSNLSTGIRVELTATRRTALHRYTFPEVLPTASVQSYPRIVIDMTNDGQGYAAGVQLQVDPFRRRVSGGAMFRGSFGPGMYHAYVCADFKGEQYEIGPPVEFGTYASGKIYPNTTSLGRQFNERGAIFTFTPQLQSSTTILARVGVSLISSEQACENAEKEIPDFGFDRVRTEARSKWSELLGRFEVQATDRNTAVLFYSSLYRSHIVPADCLSFVFSVSTIYTHEQGYSDSEENPLWLSDSPYYDSLYCNWDTYRTLFPLMSLHDPITYARIVQSFIDIQQHEGWLPECRGATIKQYIQGGSSGDAILAEFFIKYHNQATRLNVSVDDLYTALVQDAEVESPDWTVLGRQAQTWKELGYLPVGENAPGGMSTRQVSRTLEYAFDDFTISQVAKTLGKLEDGAKYAYRSRGFENVWNPDTVIEGGDGMKGFMQPRYANGTFDYTDPRHCTIHDPEHSSCFLDSFNKDGFYEGGPVVYSQYVPHDTAKLIELHGGNEAFIRRLDFIFDNGYFDSTNEPSQQIPFMYHYADRPGLSTERVRETIAQSYNTSVNGLPGNDDSGAMGSYVAFYLLGLYPLPATRQYLVSSPYFPQVKIRNPIFHTVTTINALGFKQNPATGHGGNIYVKSVTIDGVPWKSRCFIEWDVFTRGATIDLELSDDGALTCGPDSNSLPSSLSTGGYG